MNERVVGALSERPRAIAVDICFHSDVKSALRAPAGDWKSPLHTNALTATP